MAPRKHPLPKIGERFGRWTVTGAPLRNTAREPFRAPCRCDCGSEVLVMFASLYSGKSRSCGCLKDEKAASRVRTHGWSGTSLHTRWQSMLNRCYRPSEAAYKNYGGRGILVCSEWRASFVNFRDWALANGYQDNLQLDRTNNDGNYEPSNCRWVQRIININNRRSTKVLTAFGETKNLVDWLRDSRCVVGGRVLRERIREGWSHERAIAEPQRDTAGNPRSHRITAFGETKLMADWARDKRCAVGYFRLRDRLYAGWPPERALTEPKQPGKPLKFR